MNINPSATVKNRPVMSCARLFLSNPQCAHVTVTPEDNKMHVFNAGMPQAPIGVNWFGPGTVSCGTGIGPFGPAVGQVASNPGKSKSVEPSQSTANWRT